MKKIFLILVLMGILVSSSSTSILLTTSTTITINEIEIIKEAELTFRKATGYYKKAIETQSFDDYVKAIEYAEKAKELFEELGDEEGYAKSRNLIALIGSDVFYDILDFKKRREADSHYEKGMIEFLYAMGGPEKDKRIKHFNNAKQEIEKARAIYNNLYEWAEILKDTEKKKLYLGEISKCNRRLEEIEIHYYVPSPPHRGEQLYMNATFFFAKGDCENASRFAKEAKSLFEKINDLPGVYKCDILIYRINECLKKLKTADRYYENATTYYETADYENATIVLKKAKEIYEGVNNQKGIKKCNSLKEKITEMSEKKEKANELLGEAEMYFEQNRFEESIEAANEAKKIYEEIGYMRGVSKADRFIERVKYNLDIDIPSQPPLRSLLYIIILLILVIAILLIPPMVRRLKKY